MNPQDIFAQLTPDVQRQLRRYSELLAYENEYARLTGPQKPHIIMKDHVLDCLPLALALERGPVVDLGSGGGLPGIVCAIVRPELTFALIDSVAKKVAALQRMIGALGLTNLLAFATRSEDFARERRESFATATARAVTSLPELGELISPLLSLGGTMLVMKGPRWQDEGLSAQGRWGHLGLSEPTAVTYEFEGGARALVRLEKIAPCPAKYPRRAGMATKRSWTLC